MHRAGLMRQREYRDQPDRRSCSLVVSVGLRLVYQCFTVCASRRRSERCATNHAVRGSEIAVLDDEAALLGTDRRRTRRRAPTCFSVRGPKRRHGPADEPCSPDKREKQSWPSKAPSRSRRKRTTRLAPALTVPACSGEPSAMVRQSWLGCGKGAPSFKRTSGAC